jgi:uracil-DNA glycosylase
MLIGEVPGDREDLAGKPFVGPAGRLLDEALAMGGIPRDEVYVTNAVKHFKYTQRGKRRLHDKPNRYEIEACKPWLRSELEVIAPEIVVMLGATAAQALMAVGIKIVVA